jgi:hypothetical protein
VVPLLGVGGVGCGCGACGCVTAIDFTSGTGPDAVADVERMCLG